MFGVLALVQAVQNVATSQGETRDRRNAFRSLSRWASVRSRCAGRDFVRVGSTATVDGIPADGSSSGIDGRRRRRCSYPWGAE